MLAALDSAQAAKAEAAAQTAVEGDETDAPAPPAPVSPAKPLPPGDGILPGRTPRPARTVPPPPAAAGVRRGPDQGRPRVQEKGRGRGQGAARSPRPRPPRAPPPAPGAGQSRRVEVRLRVEPRVPERPVQARPQRRVGLEERVDEAPDPRRARPGQRGPLVGADPLDGPEGVVPELGVLERVPPGEEQVGRDPDRPGVDPRPVVRAGAEGPRQGAGEGAAEEELGGKVVRGAHLEGAGRVERLAQAQVDDLHLERAAVDDDVLGLHVTVADPPRVEGQEALDALPQEVARHRLRHHPAALVQEVQQVGTAHELEHQAQLRRAGRGAVRAPGGPAGGGGRWGLRAGGGGPPSRPGRRGAWPRRPAPPRRGPAGSPGPPPRRRRGA